MDRAESVIGAPSASARAKPTGLITALGLRCRRPERIGLPSNFGCFDGLSDLLPEGYGSRRRILNRFGRRICALPQPPPGLFHQRTRLIELVPMSQRVAQQAARAANTPVIILQKAAANLQAFAKRLLGR